MRISVCDDWGRVKLAFDLEVVQLKTKQLGIRRKRVKGDTWHYKKYCEDVIRSANICFPNSGYQITIVTIARLVRVQATPQTLVIIVQITHQTTNSIIKCCHHNLKFHNKKDSICIKLL